MESDKSVEKPSARGKVLAGLGNMALKFIKAGRDYLYPGAKERRLQATNRLYSITQDLISNVMKGFPYTSADLTVMAIEGGYTVRERTQTFVRERTDIYVEYIVTPDDCYIKAVANDGAAEELSNFEVDRLADLIARCSNLTR